MSSTAPTTESMSLDSSESGLKATASTTITPGVDLGRRLVEYFVIVSSVEQKSNAKSKPSEPGEPDWKVDSTSFSDIDDEFADFHFKPEITARYPIHDHPDNPLHDNICYFCHPSGSIHLRTEHFMPKVRKGTSKEQTSEFLCLALSPLGDLNPGVCLAFYFCLHIHYRYSISLQLVELVGRFSELV